MLLGHNKILEHRITSRLSLAIASNFGDIKRTNTAMVIDRSRALCGAAFFIVSVKKRVLTHYYSHALLAK